MGSVKKLKAQIQIIMSMPGRVDSRFSFLETGLRQISKVYGLIVRFRNRLYDRNILKSSRLPCFVISVGNITVGGTGKTPMTRHIARCVSAWGFKPAIITRGYGGGMEKSGGVVSDGNTIFAGPKMAGDEPYMLAKTLNVPVIAGKNRCLSSRIAIDRFSAQVLILDDGFQHRRIKRDLNILLMDDTRPVGNGFLMPRGTLREPVSGAKRGDWIVFTRSVENQRSGVSGKVAPYIGTRPQFKTKHVPYLFKYQSPNASDHVTEVLDLKGRHLTLFSGIAKNSSFRASCEDAGAIIDGHLAFDDHHKYRSKDLTRILSAFTGNRSDLVVTTLKDFTKLETRWPANVPIAILDVGIEFKHGDDVSFQAGLKKQLDSFFNSPEDLSH